MLRWVRRWARTVGQLAVAYVHRWAMGRMIRRMELEQEQREREIRALQVEIAKRERELAEEARCEK